MPPTPQNPMPSTAVSLDRNLYQRLHAAMRRAGMVPKRGRNEAADYNYASEADVLAVIRPLLLEEGLLMLPSLETWQVDRETGNAFVVLKTKIVNIDAPTEIHEVVMVGAGNDWTRNGMRDKAIYKAITGANKYTLLKTCMLPTGDDPEVARQEEFLRDDNQIDKLLEGAKTIPQHQIPSSSTTEPLSGQIGSGSSDPAFNPFALPRPNGGAFSTSTNIDPAALSPEDLQIMRMVEQSRARQEDFATAAPPPAPEVVWSRDLRRAAEDSTSSDQVIKLWNNNKEAFRRLQMENPRAYNELHSIFRDKRDTLRSEGK